jgi:hypothetical protein
MFISKNDLGDLKSKAGQVGGLQAEINQIKKQLDFSAHNSPNTFLGRLQRVFLPVITLKDVIKSVESRLDQQEKMQKMLFAHLGIEYAKITEETKAGKQEKEVLRRIKKQTK